MSNHVDRFCAAVSVLAGHGHIKQRLTKAYDEHLATIGEDELPVVVRQAFADLRHSMSRVAPHNGEGRICASVRKMSVDEAAECAESIVALYSALMRQGDGGQTLLPLEGDSTKVVPPFLVKSN